MTQEETRIHAPDLVGGYWVNSEPLSIASLRGKAVLIDFWDYTCVNCIRTLPYVTEWQRRYADHGLIVGGVHAPEFSFAKKLDGVKKAIESFGIRYPVVMDNGHAIWQAYANRYWPAKYLVDKDGYIRYFHFGEGGYEETERAIQTLLHEILPEMQLPELMSPVPDTPGAACYRVLGRTCRSSVLQDGVPIGREDAGADVMFDQNDKAFVDVDAPRMYRLVNNQGIGSHELTLKMATPGLALYAYTFVSCAVP